MLKRLRSIASGRTAVIGVPYLWLLVFFLLPFLVVARISVSEMDIATFKDLVVFKDGLLQFTLKFSGYQFIGQDPLYIDTYLRSVKYAAATTAVCLVLGYPFAYFMARARPGVQPALLMLVMLPFWTSFLLRVYAWKGLLSESSRSSRPVAINRPTGRNASEDSGSVLLAYDLAPRYCRILIRSSVSLPLVAGRKP